MSGRDKDVMIYRYDPRKRYFLVSLHMENKPGALGNLANLLGVRGINMLEGYFGDLTGDSQGTVSFFLETANQRMDEGWLKDFLKSSVYVSDVEVKTGVEGFLADSLNFPLRWNSGERAILMRLGSIHAMLAAVRASNPGAGDDTLYKVGYEYGKVATGNVMTVFTPKTKEGLAEVLSIYSASGWGRIELVELDFQRRRVKIRMRDGFESEGPAARGTGCHFTRGHLAGTLTVIFGSDAVASEPRCASRGDQYCEFDVSASGAGS